MVRLAVVHHRHPEWVQALREAEPRLDIQGWHPKDLERADWGWIAEAEGLFCWMLPMGLAPKMPRLRWVQNSGAGVDHLVRHSELPDRILITRADGGFGHWMARYVCGHLLAESQRMAECADAQALAHWNPKLQPEDLTGEKAVVVGFGRIGRQIGRALRELGLAVTGVVRSPREDGEFPLQGVERLPDLLRDARALVLATPLTDGTRGLVDARLLSHGHEGLSLFNVGRGELVVTGDLLAALDEARLRRAVLDVFPEEPLPPDSPLWRHPKITITPHHSGPSTPRQLIPDILGNLRAFAEGRSIAGAVDRDRGY